MDKMEKYGVVVDTTTLNKTAEHSDCEACNEALKAVSSSNTKNIPVCPIHGTEKWEPEDAT